MDALNRSFYIVRHAKAGSRSHWSGDDSKRPLSGKGEKQAEALVGVLQPYAITEIHSSPYLRCVQTVQPLALARRLQVNQSTALAEGHGLAGLNEFFGDEKLNAVALSTHGDIVWELVEDLVQRRVIRPGDGGFEKGSTWLVEVDEGVPVKARYMPAP